MVKHFTKFITTLLVLLLCSGASDADQAIDEKSLVQIGSRIFDLRADVSNIPRTQHFFPLTEVSWFDKLTESEPILANTTLHIREQGQVEGQPRQTFFGNREGEKITKNHPSTENIPEIFRMGGFEVRRSQSSLILYPSDRKNKILVYCATPNIDDIFCSVIADYPPDPEIYLKARIYGAKPPFHFAEIADRMREIAYCLDVTEQVKSGEYTPQIVSEDDPELPTLKACREVVL